MMRRVKVGLTLALFSLALCGGPTGQYPGPHVPSPHVTSEQLQAAQPHAATFAHSQTAPASLQQQQHPQQHPQLTPHPVATQPAPDAPDPADLHEWPDNTPHLAETLSAPLFDKDFFFRELKSLYRRKMLPLELASKYAHFQSPPLSPADFESKPMVLLLGQYSVGKTSFIRSLLQRDFPGQRIGPEPTTDRFVAIMHGEDDRVIPGHALAMRADKPFSGLQPFGNNFLTKFQGAEIDSPILHNLTLIDSPGVLSGEKQRIGRDYEFTSVVKWRVYEIPSNCGRQGFLSVVAGCFAGSQSVPT